MPVVSAGASSARAGGTSGGRSSPEVGGIAASANGPIILLGASTGGVEALHRILSRLPEDCPPILAVQHIKGAYVQSMVEGLQRAALPRVRVACDGDMIQPGLVLVAPGNSHHMVVASTGPLRCKLVEGPPVSGHRPSIDVLFRSAAQLDPPSVAALLTGMGRDGAEGLRAIRASGGHTIAQSEESCAVFGMPRAAIELGAACQVLPLDLVAPALLARAARSGGHT